MAMGAGRGSVVGMVLREAMVQALIGLAIGVPVALLCVRYVQSQLYNVVGHDVGVLSLAVVSLALSAFAAGLIPARRAASTDPVKAVCERNRRVFKNMNGIGDGVGSCNAAGAAGISELNRWEL